MLFPAKHIAAFFLLWPAASLHAQPSPPEETVFQRPLAAQATLTATRQEVPDEPPKQPPPAPLVYVTPAYVYRYEFFLTPPHGPKKLLWSHRLRVYSPTTLFPTEIRILDADLQGDTLIVVYKEFNQTYGGATSANIITNASSSARKELPFQQAEVTHDTDAAGVDVSAAKIEGSFAYKTLTLRLTNVDTFLRYTWKESKWQKVPGVAAEAPDLTLFLPSLFYEKALPDASYIRVYKKRLPADPKIIKLLNDWQAKSPTTIHVDQTDYSEAYTYKLEKNGQPPKTLLFQRTDHFVGKNLNKFEVLDVAYEGSLFTAVLNFQEPPMIYAAAIDTRKKSHSLSFQNSFQIFDSNVQDIHLMSAKINGSPSKGTLSVDVLLLNKKHLHFNWKDSKWQKALSADAPPKF